mmetsp:Transcript_57846/g.108397  ORF Transcript_57846/g.108397 Transcript_57846/m.108397 type:complete len:95 (-) Transcript_57846:17-301(-)
MGRALLPGCEPQALGRKRGHDAQGGRGSHNGHKRLVKALPLASKGASTRMRLGHAAYLGCGWVRQQRHAMCVQLTGGKPEKFTPTSSRSCCLRS